MTLQSADFFDLRSAHEAPTYQAFSPFQFASNATWPYIEWSILSYFFSHVVVRGSALKIALSWLLSTSNGQPLPSSSSKLSSPLQNFLNHHCTVHSLAVPGPNVSLTLQVVSTALWPILNSKKLLKFAFCLNIISIVQNKYKQQIMSLAKKQKVRNAIKMMYNITTFI